MTLLRILGIDRYTAKFKEWIRSKFIAKGGLKTINNESIEGKGNIEVQANAEMVLPESVGLTNIQTTSESRVFRAFYDIQTDEFTIGDLRSETQPLHFWLLNKAAGLGQILNITIKDGEIWMYSCVAEVILNPTINVQFNYLDTHYTLTWNTDTQSWDVTKTPINTGADWNAQPGEVGFIENRTHYYNEKLQYRGEIEASINHTATYVLSPYEYIDKDIYFYRAPDKIKFTGGGISFILDFIKEPIPGYNYEEDIQETVLKRFTIDGNNDIEVRYFYNGNPTYYEGVIIELDLIATDSGYREYITFTTEDYYVDLKQIDNIFLPDNIVRKSDLNFNPFILKYTLNPYIIRPNEIIPGTDGGPDDIGYYVFATGSLKSTLLTMFIVEIVDENHNSTYYKITKIIDDSTNYEDYRIGGDFGELKYDYANSCFVPV